jgi:ubiquinol-cytochrome c reductase cytochrome c1 subunit
MKITKVILVLFVLSFGLFAQRAIASEGGPHLDKIQCNACDKASLQRGAQMYVNFCSGCHSLQFVRFKEVGKGIGIVDKSGNVIESLVNENLNFISDKVNDPIKIAMPRNDATKWFGTPPPDLSLITRSRSKDWLYTYLRSFYVDPKRPWGMNNVVFPDVGMPNVFQELQGTQEPVYKTVLIKDDSGNSFEKQVVDHLELKTKGTMTPEQFDKSIKDLVNFLDYVGEPHKLERQRLGVWVILFLVVFTLFAYLLKREYWKDVH